MSSEENENISDDSLTQDDPTNSAEKINIHPNVCTDVKICCICKKESSGAHTCCKCGQIVHTICADSTLSTEEGFGSTVVCIRCAKKELITVNKEQAIEGLQAQANIMKQLSDKKFPLIEVGKTVTVPVPYVDRAKGDARNVLGAIIEKTDDGFYKVGTKRGIINTLFSRNQIQECKENLININDIPNIELS